MIVDGRRIAEGVYERIHERIGALSRVPKLTIITCNPNFETQKYLALKKKKAEAVGIEATVRELPASADTHDFIAALTESLPHTDGIVIQLPLPPQVDRDQVMRALPASHDVDALGVHTEQRLSPVVGAIREILGQSGVVIPGMHVTVIGSGKLVGLPAYRWFTEQGAQVSLVTKDTLDIEHYTKVADIVVCGAGVPGLLTPHMVREGVIILDAGTSEDGGELRGDAVPACAEKARLLTPVPGGIGPVTIAMLLRNVVDCAEEKMRVV